MLKYTIFILLCLSLFSCKKEVDFVEQDKNQPYYPDIKPKEIFRLNDTDVEGVGNPYFTRIFAADTFLVIRFASTIQVRSIRSMELLWTVPNSDHLLTYGFEDVAMIDGKLVIFSQGSYHFYDPVSGQELQQFIKRDFFPWTMRSTYFSDFVRKGTDSWFTHVQDISLYHYDWTLYHHDLKTNTYTVLHKFENVKLGGNASFGGIYRPLIVTEDGKQILISLNMLINDEDVTGIYSYNTESKTMKRIYDEPRNDHFLHKGVKGLISGNHYYFLDVKGNFSGIRFGVDSVEKLFGITPGEGSGYDAFTSIEKHNGKFYGFHSYSPRVANFDPMSGALSFLNNRNYLPAKTAFVEDKNLIFSFTSKYDGNKTQYGFQIMDLNDGQVLVEEFPEVAEGKNDNIHTIIYSPTDKTFIVHNLYAIYKYELPELFK